MLLDCATQYVEETGGEGDEVDVCRVVVLVTLETKEQSPLSTSATCPSTCGGEGARSPTSQILQEPRTITH